MGNIENLYKQFKSEVRILVRDNIEYYKQLISGHDKKIILGTFILFMGGGLIATGVIEKALSKK